MKKLDRFQFDLVALAVAYAFGAHAQHLPPWLTLLLGILLIARWTQRRWRPSLGGFPLWLRLPLTLGLPLGVIFTYGNIFGRDPGSALATGLLVLKLCESETPRDARSAVTFGSFMLMAALLFDQSLLGTLLVALGLVPQMAALRALQFEGDATQAPRATRREYLSAGVALLLAVPLSAAAFLFLPRLATPLWGAPTPEHGKTGVGDDMRPGSISELLIDDSPAFRVTFYGQSPTASQRYWRGKVLWHYDGAVWEGSPWRSLGRGGSKAALSAANKRMSYDVTLEPTQQNKLYVLDMPTQAPADTDLSSDMTVSRERPITELLNYRGEAALEYRLEGLTPRWRQTALELPQGFNPRSVALAKAWRSRAKSDMEVVDAALKLFNDSFSYTLNAPPLGRDEVDDFLFNTKAGFCQHFSSSFTVLMRAAGIPARVVIGYQGGYWNDLGGYLVVRQSDAHAWSEVWLDDRGWVRIDPTGAVSPQRVQLGAQLANGGEKPWYGADWMVGLRNRWDVVNRFWNDAIVRFDSVRQSSLLTAFGVKKAETRELGIALVVSAALFIGLALWWTLREAPDTGDALDRAWSRLRKLLERRGLERRAGEGPRDYAERALVRWPAARERLAPLFDTYLSLRYARADFEPGDVETFSRAVREFRRSRSDALIDPRDDDAGCRAVNPQRG